MGSGALRKTEQHVDTDPRGGEQICVNDSGLADLDGVVLEETDDPLEFRVRILKAGRKVGLTLSRQDESNCLKIRAVKDGLIQEWNRQNPGSRVAVGCEVIEVNGFLDVGRMMDVVQEADELSMLMRRVQT